MIRVDETDPVGELEPSFPYRDVTVRKGVEFKDYYDIESEIGRGKFGTVYRCKEKKTGLALATKVVNATRKEDRRDVEREVEIMRRLQHPRLIQLYDAIECGKQIYVVLELIAGGELFERVIDDDFVLTERSCAVFMRQICEGIEFVHSQNILHLDMKPENILCLTKEGNRIKIIDFGLAREYDPKKKLQVLFGTPEFVAPEVVNFDQIGFGTDMWSIGVICYVLLSGLSPFMGDTDIETMANVTIAKYDFDHEAFADISDDAKDFIRCLLVKDITIRASARQCREHRWLAHKYQSPVELAPTATTTTTAAKTTTMTPMPASVCNPRTSTNGSPADASNDDGKNSCVAAAAGTATPAVSISIDNSGSSKGNANVSVPKVTTSQVKEVNRGPVNDGARGKRVVTTAAAAAAAGTSVELDVTKDNLRLFVERWREHPDSPYGIELQSMLERRASHEENGSLYCQSPSPCGSICSSSASLVAGFDADLPSSDAPNFLLGVPELALALERRASEGGRSTEKAIDPASQILLAEEIIRLSEHLRSIAGSPPAPTTDAEVGTPKPQQPQQQKENSEKKQLAAGLEVRSKLKPDSDVIEVERDVNEISEKLTKLARQRKLNGTTFNGSRNFEKYYGNNDTSLSNLFNLRRSSRNNDTSASANKNSYSSSSSTSTTTTTIVTRSAKSQEEKKKKLEDDEGKDADNDNDDDKKKVSNIGEPSENRCKSSEIDLTPPWRQGRMKRRFGETCRDVPRIAMLQNLHKNMNLNEPARAKNLLLQLIDEWSETRRPGSFAAGSGSAGRKSISLDWCAEESVARKSINSLAEYFQSEQQKVTAMPPAATATGTGGSVR